MTATTRAERTRACQPSGKNDGHGRILARLCCRRSRRGQIPRLTRHAFASTLVAACRLRVLLVDVGRRAGVAAPRPTAASPPTRPRSIRRRRSSPTSNAQVDRLRERLATPPPYPPPARDPFRFGRATRALAPTPARAAPPRRPPRRAAAVRRRCRASSRSLTSDVDGARRTRTAVVSMWRRRADGERLATVGRKSRSLRRSTRDGRRARRCSDRPALTSPTDSLDAASSPTRRARVCIMCRSSRASDAHHLGANRCDASKVAEIRRMRREFSTSFPQIL